MKTGGYHGYIYAYQDVSTIEMDTVEMLRVINELIFSIAIHPRVDTQNYS